MTSLIAGHVERCRECHALKGDNAHSCLAEYRWRWRESSLEDAFTGTGISVAFSAPGEWGLVATDPEIIRDVRRRETEQAAVDRLRVLRLWFTPFAWRLWTGGVPLVDVVAHCDGATVGVSVETESHPDDIRPWNALASLP